MDSRKKKLEEKNWRLCTQTTLTKSVAGKENRNGWMDKVGFKMEKIGARLRGNFFKVG